MKDDNYITHTYAVLDASKQFSAKGIVSNLATFQCFIGDLCSVVTIAIYNTSLYVLLTFV